MYINFLELNLLHRTISLLGVQLFKPILIKSRAQSSRKWKLDCN